MKRLAVYLALILPALLLGWWAIFPEADPVLDAPLFHFYIVTFSTFAATVVSLFVTISVGETALPRHLLLAMAFVWMGALFFIHGVTTPNAIITHFHPALQWSAWLTLFGGGVIFLAGAFAPDAPNPRLLRTVAISGFIFYLFYAAVVILWPGLLTNLLRLPIVPRLQDLAFGLTLLVWLTGSAKHYWNYRHSQNTLDGLMAFEAGWYTTATVSMFQFPVFNASWWLYHVLLLFGFLIAIYALWRGYEQVRAFRLSRYYAATSLIVTAALALFAAHLFSQFVYQNVLAQLENGSEALSRSIAADLGAEQPDVQTAADLPRFNAGVSVRLSNRLASLEVLKQVNLYDPEATIVFSTDARQVGVGLPEWANRPSFQNALAGTAAFLLYEPGLPPANYAPAQSTYILETYLPFYPGGDAQSAPIGVLVTTREAPELAQTVTLSRRSGIGLSALSLGGLFLALFVIVRRADQLITARSRELEQAYANLREAEGLRDDLTNMIVHDLRNPLTAITSNLDLIGRTLNNPAYADAPPRFLSGARSAGQRMIGMIDDLLNVSKFEAGELRPVLAPVYLPTLLAEKEEAYRAQAEREEKTFALHAPAELPTVMADAGLIGRVIDNVVSNAFKYTESGGHIEVSVEHKGQALVVQVRDDGQGIPPEYHKRIFDKFVQVADQNGAPLRKGTGLGLAFCRLAVEAHGGAIWVRSAPGQGSTFSFTLPVEGS